MAGAAPQPHTKGGKKSLDAEINLVPFIDLLSCCISFLLITAVWTQIAGLQVASSGGPPEPQQRQEQTIDLKLISSRYVQPFGSFSGHVTSPAGERIEVRDLPGVAEDHEALW